MNIFISLSVIFWSLFPSLLSYTQGGEEPNKVQLTNLVVNGDLTTDNNIDSVPDGFSLTGTLSNQTYTNGIMKFTTTSAEAGLVKNNIPTTANDKWYAFAYIKTSGSSFLDGFNSFTYLSNSLYNQWVLLSKVSISNTQANNYIGAYALQNQTIEIDYIGAYNVSEMITNGVKSDNGTLFSDMSNADIKTQLDTWVSQIPDGYNSSYYLSTSINDQYKWFSTGFVDKTSERDFLDYLGFFVWLVVPPISIYLLYKLMKGIIYE